MDEKRKGEILDVLKKAGSNEYETSWDDSGNPKSKKKSNISQGKKSRASGAQFELRVRKDLEEKGWTVDKWSNNFDLETNEVCPAKRKFNPYNKVMTIGTGFPDFIAFKSLGEKSFDVIGVEVKVNGLLDKTEKEKCKALLEKGVFNEVLVASKEKEGRNIKIIYQDVKERFSRFFN